jgi:hypothetical protein
LVQIEIGLDQRPEFGEHPVVKASAALYQGRCEVERLAFQESFPDESLDRMLSEGKRLRLCG